VALCAQTHGVARQLGRGGRDLIGDTGSAVVAVPADQPQKVARKLDLHRGAGREVIAVTYGRWRRYKFDGGLARLVRDRQGELPRRDRLGAGQMQSGAQLDRHAARVEAATAVHLQLPRKPHRCRAVGIGSGGLELRARGSQSGPALQGRWRSIRQGNPQLQRQRLRAEQGADADGRHNRVGCEGQVEVAAR
jgi:hypothetical protein